MTVDLSALIVNYRTYDALRQSLSALQHAATTLTLEILIADNEPDPEAIADLNRSFESVRIVPLSRNIGFGAAVNLAAQRATGRYLLVLNADTTLRPMACDTLVRFADTRPDVGAIGPRIFNRDDTVQGSARRFPDVSTLLFGRRSWLTRWFPSNPWSRWNIMVDHSAVAPRQVDWVSGCCVLVSRSAFEQLGGFDPKFFLYWEDADLCRRLSDHGQAVVYLPSAEAVHSVGLSTGQVPYRAIAAFHAGAFRYARKHVRGASRLLLAPLAGFLLMRSALQMLATLVRNTPSTATRLAPRAGLRSEPEG